MREIAPKWSVPPIAPLALFSGGFHPDWGEHFQFRLVGFRSVRLLSGNMAVFTAKEKQRFSTVNFRVLHFPNHNRVISRNVR